MKPGDKLGPYEIVVPFGAGGMGEVFKARDTRLGRDVAIKISNEKFSDRFEREARSIAALNHPNICQLYDVGPDYLVMELIDGERSKVLCRSIPRSTMQSRSPALSKPPTTAASFIAISSPRTS
jgi:serine/threonine protein kinase